MLTRSASCEQASAYCRSVPGLSSCVFITATRWLMQYRHVAGQVADFGLSRHNPNKHTVATRTCGGITHAAPELIREGRLSPATGVAFSVLNRVLLPGPLCLSIAKAPQI
jgi:hypothetical protein